MTIVRMISIGIVMMVALTATFDATYAQQAPLAPCCALKNGVWIVTKTGKPASPAQIRSMQPAGTIKADAPKTGGTTGSSNPGRPIGLRCCF
jgi:hypothetical protein